MYCVIVCLGTHLELQQTLKMHFVLNTTADNLNIFKHDNLAKLFSLNISADNKFFLNRAFKGLYQLPCHSSKVVFILNEYLNKYFFILSLGTHLELKQTLKFASHKNQVLLITCAKIEPFEELFWHRSDSMKVVLIANEYLNI